MYHNITNFELMQKKKAGEKKDKDAILCILIFHEENEMKYNCINQMKNNSTI